MKFALLGVDRDALELIDQLCRTRQHELLAAYDIGEAVEAVREHSPRVEIGEAPEALLARPEIDAVIVATSEDLPARERQLRTLVQGGLRLVVMVPICDSLTAYELEMIRSEASAVMVPYSAGRGHPAIGRLAELIQQGDRSPIGAVEQIVFERHMTRRDRDTIMPQLCRDAHPIARLIGDIQGVSATGDDQNPFKNLGVGLNGSNGLSARWLVVPTASAARATLTLHGERCQATLDMPVDGPWRLIFEHDEVPDETWPDETWPDWDAAAAVVDELQERRAGMGSWFETCRDLEIADHVAASLRRKRTIEIRRDGNPEENAFKGIMSAGGCLILLTCLLVLLGFAVVEGFRMPMLSSPAEVLEMRNQDVPRAHILWRLLPAYPLLAFLALQALLIVAKSGRKADHDQPK